MRHSRLFPLPLAALALQLSVAAPLWAQTELSFDRSRFAVGEIPHAFALGDFNGDGQQDLATGSNFGSVSVLLSRGDGTFEPTLNTEMGETVVSITAGDFNGDGRQDIATANVFGAFSDGSVSILLGQGDGTFAPLQPVALPANPMSIIAGDFNGDGQQDLATASSSNTNVSILLGNGDSTFVLTQILEVIVNPAQVITGEFNGDSQQDLATANVNGDRVSVLLGQGDGTFELPRDFAVGDAPFSVAAGDFNGDSLQDLATANLFGVSTNGSVSVLLGQGDGTFEPARSVDVGGNTHSVVVGDFDRDGRQDLATSNSNVNTASILLGNGDGTFQAPRDFAAGIGPGENTVGDFNGDGRQDLANINAPCRAASVLINTTPLETTVQIDIRPGSNKNRIHPGSNGKVRVAILSSDSFDATAVDPTTVRFGRTGTEAAPVHFALRDVDGDGNSDMILRFRIRDTGIVCGDTSAALSGRTFSGQVIEGSDSIRTVGCGH